MSESEKLGALLRELRRARRHSVRRLARLAGVAPSTVTRWESGSTAPRLYELYALLAALDVTRDEARAVREAFRATFGAVRRSGRLDVTERPAAPISLDSAPAPVSGDLLRALRLRRAVCQADLARAVGTTQASIARFERGESFPCAQTLSQMAFALGASEAETAALLRGRWGLQDGLGGLAPEADAPVLDWLTAERMVHESYGAWDGLEDLRFLSLRALLLSSPFRDSEPGRYRSLARLASRYAMFLSDRGRLAEAEAAASEALQLGAGDDSLVGWDTRIPALLAMAERAVYTENNPLIDRRLHSVGFVSAPATGARRKRLSRGIRLLEPIRSHWSRPAAMHFPEIEAAWVDAHLARYAAGLGDAAGAIFLAREAVARIAADVPHYSGDRRLRQQLLARLLVRGGEAAEALSLTAHLSASSATAPIAYLVEESLSRLAAHRSLARQSGGKGWHRAQADNDAAFLMEQVCDSSLTPGIREEAVSLMQSESSQTA